MLSIYDLYDLHAIFVRIRFSPEDDKNYEIVSKVIGVLADNRGSSEANQFRIDLRSINGLENNALYDFVYVDNKYTYYPLSWLKEERIYEVLSSCCKEMLRVITKNNTECVAELADCLHNLPILIVENKLTIPKTFWKNEVKLYRKKWNKHFLMLEQQNFSKKHRIKRMINDFRRK